MMGLEEAAKAAKIAVWWDMKDCPIPEGYDARRVRPSLEAACKSVGYSGPVSITAYGDQTQIPGHHLRGLCSTGVAVAHTRPESTNSLMYSDMLEWRDQNPAPASMMIISNQVNTVFAWDLARQQQRTLYNLFLVYSERYQFLSALEICREWLWEEVLGVPVPDRKIQGFTDRSYADGYKIDTRSAPLVEEKCSDTSELSAMLYCKSCNFKSQSPRNFRKHLSSYKHARKEAVDPTSTIVDFVTETWGRDYPATPEYATAKIAVWWDMFDCPIPEGYDTRRVRPSLEAAFKNLGYSGPVSITAFGDLNRIPDHLLVGLSSTGVTPVHCISFYVGTHIDSDVKKWLVSNPPPATIMVITNHLGSDSTCGLVTLLQVHKHKLFLAYSYRPHKMPNLLTSAEWLWESLLAVSETRGQSESFSKVPETRKHGESFSTLSETGGHVLRKCSNTESFSTVPETRGHVLRKCSNTESFSTLPETRGHVPKSKKLYTLNEARTLVLQKCSETEGESTSIFYCIMCVCSYKSLDDLRTHFSTEKHTQKEGRINAYWQCYDQKQSPLAQYDRQHWREVQKIKRMRKEKIRRMRKSFRTGFRLHLRLTNRG